MVKDWLINFIKKYLFVNFSFLNISHNNIYNHICKNDKQILILNADIFTGDRWHTMIIVMNTRRSIAHIYINNSS